MLAIKSLKNKGMHGEAHICLLVLSCLPVMGMHNEVAGLA
jgi:hypothetical protein